MLRRHRLLNRIKGGTIAITIICVKDMINFSKFKVAIKELDDQSIFLALPLATAVDLRRVSLLPIWPLW